MPKMSFQICCHAEVEEIEEGRQLLEKIKERLADLPNLKIGGGIHVPLNQPQEVTTNEEDT